jgi:hypothetical protein
VASTHHHRWWCPQAVRAPSVLRRSLHRPIVGRECEHTRYERDDASTDIRCNISELVRPSAASSVGGAASRLPQRLAQSRH